MRLLILIPIQLYWHLWPARWKNRQCLFRESCSHHVCRVTKEFGFIAGCKSLFSRIRNCRPGYRVQMLEDGTFQLVLVSGSSVDEPEISSAVLRPYLKARDVQYYLPSESCRASTAKIIQ